MKRPFAWLALPLVLCALVLGVKWRAEHPIPTKLDLEIRVLMTQASSVDVYHHPNTSKLGLFQARLSKEESQVFHDSFYLLSQRMNESSTVLKPGATNGKFDIMYFIPGSKKNVFTRVYVSMDVYGSDGEAYVDDLSKGVKYKLHPITVKRWMELLFNHRRIGPQLRTRMNS